MLICHVKVKLKMPKIFQYLFYNSLYQGLLYSWE